jgi:HPt (histidine-containing phosphotransfer) domain-containing protein
MTEPHQIAEQMRALRRRFRERCQERGRDLLIACEERDRGEVENLAHDITGSAGLFGYPALSEAAGELSAKCKAGADDAAFETARVLCASLLAVAAEKD